MNVRDAVYMTTCALRAAFTSYRERVEGAYSIGRCNFFFQP
jgi:hypothetical protein